MTTDYFVDLLFSTLVPIAFTGVLGVLYSIMKQRRYSAKATNLIVSCFLLTTYLVLTSCSKKVVRTQGALLVSRHYIDKSARALSNTLHFSADLCYVQVQRV